MHSKLGYSRIRSPAIESFHMNSSGTWLPGNFWTRINKGNSTTSRGELQRFLCYLRTRRVISERFTDLFHVLFYISMNQFGQLLVWLPSDSTHQYDFHVIALDMPGSYDYHLEGTDADSNRIVVNMLFISSIEKWREI